MENRQIESEFQVEREENIMSTRAYIGIKNTDGTVSAIYNHSDGGLENLGHLLRKYFKTEDQVRELIDTGFISSIQDNRSLL